MAKYLIFSRAIGKCFLNLLEGKIDVEISIKKTLKGSFDFFLFNLAIGLNFFKGSFFERKIFMSIRVRGQ